MANVLQYAIDTYLSNIKLILFFSLAFVIAFLIPVFASFPTYNDAGAILLRTASLFLNLNIFNTAVIVIAIFFSLLFLSFAVVAINVVVKHSRTRTKVGQEVIRGLERYTSKVFVVLLIATLIVFVVNVLTYSKGYSAVVTALAELVIAPFIFYAPASIVIDENKVTRSFQASLNFFMGRLDYVALWVVIALALITLFDLVFMVAGPSYSAYAMLVFDSLFVLPFLVLLQSELYMKRFRMLRR